MQAPRGELRRSLRRAEFRRATRDGSRLVTQYFLVFRVDRRDAGVARLGITVTRKVGNAVRRNRIKRLVREWFRRRRQEVGPCDLVVIAKQGLPERIGLAAVAQDLDRLLGPRAGPGDSPWA